MRVFKYLFRNVQRGEVRKFIINNNEKF